MRLEQLPILLDLAQTHSFNQTAERQFKTQQSISYYISQLEKELNIQIFHRSKTGVEFTPDGEFVLRFAKQTLDAYQEMMSNICKDDYLKAQPAPAVIKLHMASVLLGANMPNIMESFSKQYPLTQIIIKEVEHDAILPALVDGSCDLAVWTINQGFFEKNICYYHSDLINYTIMSKDKPVAVISSKSELAKKEVLTSEDVRFQTKNVFGLLPENHYNTDTKKYALYEDNNLAIHKQMMLDANAICFMTEASYHIFFKSSKFVARNLAFPVLPIYNLLLRSKSAGHIAHDALCHIIKSSFL